MSVWYVNFEDCEDSGDYNSEVTCLIQVENRDQP